MGRLELGLSSDLVDRPPALQRLRLGAESEAIRHRHRVGVAQAESLRAAWSRRAHEDQAARVPPMGRVTQLGARALVEVDVERCLQRSQLHSIGIKAVGELLEVRAGACPAESPGPPFLRASRRRSAWRCAPWVAGSPPCLGRRCPGPDRSWGRRGPKRGRSRALQSRTGAHVERLGSRL